MKSVKQKILKPIFLRHGVQLAYFFGSRATGSNSTTASDYDFAVFFGTGTAQSRFAQRLQILHDIQQILTPKQVDLIVLDDLCSATLRYEVVATGKLIFEARNARRIDFEFKTLHDYEDFFPFLKAYNKVYMTRV